MGAGHRRDEDTMKTSFGYANHDLAPKLYDKSTHTVGIWSKYAGRHAGGSHVDAHEQGAIKATVLTRETAAEFIEALIAAYCDVDYNRQMLAATRRPDSGHDKFEDKRRSAAVRLGFESPVLERFGFSPTTLGQIRARSALDTAVGAFPDLKEAISKMEALALPKESPGGDGEAGETVGRVDVAELPPVVALSNMRKTSFFRLPTTLSKMPGRRWLCAGGDSDRGLEVSKGGECITVNFEEDWVVEYLQPNAVVEELWLMYSPSNPFQLRLQYKLITGRGPPEGWVDVQDTRGDGREFMLAIEAAHPAPWKWSEMGPQPMPDGYVDGIAPEPEITTAIALPAENYAEAWVQRMIEAAAEVAPAKERAEDALASMVRLKNKDGIERALAQALAAGALIEECSEAVDLLKSLEKALKSKPVTSDMVTKKELKQSLNDQSLRVELAFERYCYEEAENLKDEVPSYERPPAMKMCSVCGSKEAPAYDDFIIDGQFMCSDCARDREKQLEEERLRLFAMEDLLAPLEGPAEHLALEAGEPEPAPAARQLALEAGTGPSADARLEALEAGSAWIRAAGGGGDIGGLAREEESSRDALAVTLLDALEQQCQTPEFLADLGVVRGAGGPSFKVGLRLLLTKHCLAAAATHKLGGGWTFDSAKSFLVEHAHSAGIAERLRVFERSLVHQDGDLFGEIAGATGHAPPAEPPGPAPPAEPPGPPPAEAKDADAEYQVVQLPEVDMPVTPPEEEKAREREELEKELTRVRDDKLKAVMEEDFLRAHSNQMLEKDLVARLQVLS